MFDEWILLVEEMNNARLRVKSGESIEEEAEGPFGVKFRFRRGPDDSVETFVESGAETASAFGRTFPETQDRPSTYPTDLPFLPSVSVSILDMPGGKGRRISWHRVTDVSGKASLVRHQLIRSGWVLGRRSWILLGLLGREIEFRKGGALRTLVVRITPGGRSTLSLIERY